MARDRLAAMRAQQGGGGGAGGYGGYGGGNNGYGDHSYPTQQTGGGPAYQNYAAQAQGQGQGQGYPEPQAQPYQQQQQGYNQQQDYAQSDDPYGGGGGNQAYEMQNVQQNAGGAQDTNAFFAEIDDVRDTMRQIDQNVNRIQDLHSRSLNNMDEQSSQQAHQELGTMISETSRLTNAVKNRIRNLDAQANRLPEGGDKNVRKTQIGVQKNQFKELIQRYITVERDYQRKYRARAERQYRIVKPDASQAEVKAALDDDQGQQIFSQALLNSNRHGEARGALREVQERHEDIKKIERTITELAQLFNEVDTLLAEQDDQLNQIQDSAVAAETDMKQGVVHTDKAVVSARKARRKRKICAVIILILIIIVIIVVVVVICQQGTNCGRKPSNQPARRALEELVSQDNLNAWARRAMEQDFEAIMG